MPRFSSTFCSDPLATHIVETADDKNGYGIYGYYNEFAAHHVARDLRKTGAPIVNVKLNERNWTGVHPLIPMF